MTRGFSLLALLAICAGCQSQNPLAAFGPATIAAPRSAQAPPYYPPALDGGDKRKLASSPSSSIEPSGRISVSAEGSVAASAPPSRTTLDQADKDPIRIVENPSAAAKTASNPPRDIRQPNTSPSNSIQQPHDRSTAPRNNLPGVAPEAKHSGSLSNQRPIGLAKNRGYITGDRSAVVPASYERSTPTFVETPATEGTWRSR